QHSHNKLNPQKKSPRATAAEARSGRRTRRTTVDRRSGDGSASAALRRKTIVENISRVGVARRESETSFLCGPATRRNPAEDAARNAGVAVADESADTSPRRIVRSARRSGLDEDIRELRTKTLVDRGRRRRSTREEDAPEHGKNTTLAIAGRYSSTQKRMRITIV
ncbi:hypothetical protein Hamer_G010131, partial [Homarus americanus]